MKSKKQTLLLPIAMAMFFLFGISNSAFCDDGVGAGGGGDKVEPLYLEAARNAKDFFNHLTLNSLNQLELEPVYKNFLTLERISKIQYYSRKVKIFFQEDSCITGNEARGAAYYFANPADLGRPVTLKPSANEGLIPVICISRKMNANSSRAEAQALIFHELGHFSGEGDHLFLSDLGSVLSSRMLVSGDLTSRRLYLTGATRDAIKAMDYRSEVEPVIFSNSSISLQYNCIRYLGLPNSLGLYVIPREWDIKSGYNGIESLKFSERAYEKFCDNNLVGTKIKFPWKKVSSENPLVIEIVDNIVTDLYLVNEK